MLKVAVIGGGPGGLFTSYLLDEYHNDIAKVTIFESADRIGGKILTETFSTAPVKFEAGLAEIYNYSRLGPDPLQDLVKELGLETIPLVGRGAIFQGHLLRSEMDIGRIYGAAALEELLGFYKKCSDYVSPESYYEDLWIDDNASPLANQSFTEFLETITDYNVRRFVEIVAHSDVACEAGQTTALDGLKNVLMDHPAYMRLVGIKGGNQLLIEKLEDAIDSNVHLNTHVTEVKPNGPGFTLTFSQNSATRSEDFDIVICALPNHQLQRINWPESKSRHAVQRHLARYDKPAHYLRVSVLFSRAFWRLKMNGAYFMSDAFNGCCIYDEGQRHPAGDFGVLSWLIAGNDAMVMANMSDQVLLKSVLDSLPPELVEGRELAIECKVHRWVGAINGLPGGNPVLPLEERHMPDAVLFPNLYCVGDYLFDSTLNGTFDSADFVAGRVATQLRKAKYLGVEQPMALTGTDGQLGKIYFDYYDGGRSYAQSLDEYFNEHYVRDLIEAVWDRKPPYKLLDCGSASGLTLERFEKIGIEAWGVEDSKDAHSQTAAKWKDRNLHGDVRKLPFPDESFDFVYDTALCYLTGDDIDTAIRELHRVCRIGVFISGISSDMTKSIVEQHELFEGVPTLMTMWEWSEKFVKNGFRPATSDIEILADVWEIEKQYCEDAIPWYPDIDTMRHCFYTKAKPALGSRIPDLTREHRGR